MNQITYKFVHPQFKLNGFHYNENQLFQLANSYISVGELYQKQAGNFILNWFDSNLSINLQTSGSTGSPKIIIIEKQAMVNSALATGLFFDLKPTDKGLHCLPSNFIAGKMQFVRAFILGLEIDFVEPNSNPLASISTEYDFAAMVPLQVQNSISNLKKIKKLIIGGSKINPNLEKALLQIRDISIFETYGMTETVSHVAAKRVGEQSFKMLQNVTINVDKRNCLIIYAPNIYDKEIITNDLVEITSKNEFSLIGRIDNVINSGGVKLFPEKIESKLFDKIENRFFVTGIADEVLGQKLILVIEGEKYTVDKMIFNDLDKFEKPKDIVFMSNFFETETGKIIRKL